MMNDFDIYDILNAQKLLMLQRYFLLNSYWFLFNSHINMIGALTIRNATILSKYEVNKSARIILSKIISDAIARQVSVMLEYINNRRESETNVLPVYYIPSPEDFASVLSEGLVHNNKFIDKVAKELLLSLFSVLNLPLPYIEEELRRKRLQLKLKVAKGDELAYESREEIELARKIKTLEEEEHKRDNTVEIDKLKDAIGLYEVIVKKST